MYSPDPNKLLDSSTNFLLEVFYEFSILIMVFIWLYIVDDMSVFLPASKGDNPLTLILGLKSDKSINVS